MTSIKLDVELCQGHGQCEVLAPKYFAVEDTGKAQVLLDHVVAGDEEQVQDAALHCPELAVILES